MWNDYWKMAVMGSDKIWPNSEGGMTYIAWRRVDSPRRGYARLPLSPTASHRGAKRKKMRLTLFAAQPEGRPAQRSRGESWPAFKANVHVKPNLPCYVISIQIPDVCFIRDFVFLNGFSICKMKGIEVADKHISLS
jgi:hypothetical protein